MAEPSSAHVRLLVDFKDGKNMLEFGPATRHSMLNRGREMYDAGLKHADYYIGDDLIVFGTVVLGTKGEADAEEAAGDEEKPKPPPTALTGSPRTASTGCWRATTVGSTSRSDAKASGRSGIEGSSRSRS